MITISKDEAQVLFDVATNSMRDHMAFHQVTPELVAAVATLKAALEALVEAPAEEAPAEEAPAEAQ